MADTFVAQVENGLNTTVAFARQRRQFDPAIMPKLADRRTLTEGTGSTWRETIIENITAQNYGETDIIDNAQTLSVALLTATPQLVAVQTFIGRRVQARISSLTFQEFGTAGQGGMDRKKNTDGHALFAAASTTLGATGTTATAGHFLAGINRIKADATEPGPDPIAIVIHGYTSYDVQSEILSGLGTYTVPTGLTENTFRKGFSGTLGGANVFVDGLIAVDGTPDTRGGIFSSGPGGAIILVQGISPWTETKDRPEKGHGGVDVYLKDEYVYVERSAGNWLFGHLANASVPTG